MEERDPFGPLLDAAVWLFVLAFLAVLVGMLATIAVVLIATPG